MKRRTGLEYYILDENHNVKQVRNVLEWGKWLEKNRGDGRRVKQQQLKNGAWISTVFLGLDHSFNFSKPPLLFETMVFPNKRNLSELDMERYSTWDEALAGHKQMVRRWKNKIIKL